MIHPILSVQAHIQTFVLKNFKYTHYAMYLRKIHNSHLGESCFIIGHGPSLTADDLNVLWENKIDCFGVNRVFKIFPQTHWRPTYYVNTDAVLIRDCLDDVDKIPAKEKFIPLQNHYYLDANVKGVHYFFRNDIRENDQPEGFSLDCTNQINVVGTVTIASMQLAMHMGYRHIYLLGVDHSFDKIITEDGEVVVDPSVKNYFIEGYDDDISNEVQHDIGYTTKQYLRIAKFAKDHDVEIINATRTTKLTAFRCCSFEEALKEINERKN